MAKWTVTISSNDSDDLTATPMSLQANQGDEIEFSASHAGTDYPIIFIDFLPDVNGFFICANAPGDQPVLNLTLYPDPDDAKIVKVCSNAGAQDYKYKIELRRSGQEANAISPIIVVI